MTDTLSLIRDLLIAQRDSSTLCTVPAGLMDQAERTLENLKLQYRQTGDDRISELHESIATVLDELQEHRAEMIWEMAYYQVENTKALTDKERFIFDILAENAAKLRGIA